MQKTEAASRSEILARLRGDRIPVDTLLAVAPYRSLRLYYADNHDFLAHAAFGFGLGQDRSLRRSPSGVRLCARTPHLKILEPNAGKISEHALGELTQVGPVGVRIIARRNALPEEQLRLIPRAALRRGCRGRCVKDEAAGK